MKTTAKSLRMDTKRILDAVERGEEVIVSKRGIYFLEVNTLPGLDKESLFHKSLNAVGSSLSNFLDHIISLARNKQ